MAKTERLAIKILRTDKAALQRMAEAEGEPVAVVLRKIIRRAVREFATSGATAQPAELEAARA